MTSLSGAALFELLLVEDNEADVVLMQEAFGVQCPQARLHVARDGVAALDLLHRSILLAGIPRPDLILLDLNLPRKGGLEVLEERRADPVLRAIPVVVLSTSGASRDIQRAYDLGANAYLLKPRDLPGVFEQVRLIAQFWFSAVQLPNR